MKPEFVDMVRRASQEAGNQRKLAKALGLSEKTISGVINGAGYPFGFENCLKLARLLGEEPADVLRAADKGQLAELLEETYGRQPVTIAQRTLLDDFDALPSDLQTNLRALISTSAKRERDRRASDRRRRRP